MALIDEFVVPNLSWASRHVYCVYSLRHFWLSMLGRFAGSVLFRFWMFICRFWVFLVSILNALPLQVSQRVSGIAALQNSLVQERNRNSFLVSTTFDTGMQHLKFTEVGTTRATRSRSSAPWLVAPCDTMAVSNVNPICSFFVHLFFAFHFWTKTQSIRS